MQNMGDYSILAALAGIYVLVIFRYQATPRYLLIATVIFAVIYFVWGVIHHLKNKNFHAKIVLEYFLVALLGVAIVSTLLI
jgi:hypothetical protein